ncbi:MAG: hypothetical protein A2V93_00670 [Ignavibacteria bacterium RBG_16_34_14]|nr:MAG: hypothetical protein A2V93_00670 [Ignavibacteria bacterium RBG_16_34_14]
MISRRSIVLVVLLLIISIACSQSPEEKARKELKRMNIEYTENSFIKYVEKGDKAIVDLFLAAGMSPNLKKSDYTEEPILNIAAAYNHAEIVTLLLAKGADVNAKSKKGISALTIAARSGRTEIVTLLLAKGADVNANDNKGWTALMEAVQIGNTNTVDILEKAGATIPKESIEGFLTVADSQWQKGDYQNAIQSYQEILSLDPNNSKAKEFLKKYSAAELTYVEIAAKFKKEPGLNEFELKERAKEQKEFLARTETYFSIIKKSNDEFGINMNDEFAISKYDFKKKRYIVTVGLREGNAIGPLYEGYSGQIWYDIFLIVNEDGKHLVFPLYIEEEKASLLKSQNKEEQKVLIIYKLKKVERFTDTTVTTPSRANPRGGAIYMDMFRWYIRPLYVALLTENEKYVLYEEKLAKQAEQKKDYKKTMKKK